MNHDPFGFGRAILQAAFTVLAVALCLYWAAQLIERVWPVLVISGSVAAGLWLTWKIVRYRHERW